MIIAKIFDLICGNDRPYITRSGRDTEARHAYQRALELAQTEPERRFLQDRLSELEP